jgi:hypothetical protein
MITIEIRDDGVFKVIGSINGETRTKWGWSVKKTLKDFADRYGDALEQEIRHESRKERAPRAQAPKRPAWYEDYRKILHPPTEQYLETFKEDFEEGDTIFLAYSYKYNASMFVLWTQDGTYQHLRSAIRYLEEKRHELTYARIVFCSSHTMNNVNFEVITERGRAITHERKF